ncbi:MAG: hypothetical protein ACOYJ6_15255 [Caulobacterales bacterium]|jgi:hypothetical protein
MSPISLDVLVVTANAILWAAVANWVLPTDPQRRTLIVLMGAWGGLFALLGLQQRSVLDVVANGLLFALVMAPMAKLQGWIPFLPFKTPHARIRTLCFASALAFAVLMAPLSRI